MSCGKVHRSLQDHWPQISCKVRNRLKEDRSIATPVDRYNICKVPKDLHCTCDQRLMPILYTIYYPLNKLDDTTTSYWCLQPRMWSQEGHPVCVAVVIAVVREPAQRRRLGRQWQRMRCYDRTAHLELDLLDYTLEVSLSICRILES